MLSYGFFTAMLVVIVEGMLTYVLDRHIGTKVIYWWNGATSEAPPSADEIKGFIYRRKAHMRLTTAIIITLIQNGLLFFAGMVHPLTSVVSVPFELIALMIGFYAGPWLDRLWSRKQPILDVIDKLESGETTVSKELKHVAGSVRESLHPWEKAEKVVPIARPASSPATISETAVPPEKKSEKTLAQQIEENPTKYIREFTHGGSKDGE